MLRFLLFFIVFSCLISSVFAASLNGSYTIDPKGSGFKNYTSFRKAAKALKDSGVSGPVVFDVADGTYKEFVEIDKIKGASASNKVIFESKSLDSSKVVLTTNQAGIYTQHGYALLLNGCNYVTIHGITLKNIIASSPGYGDVIEFTGNTKYNTIENCRLISNTGNTILNQGCGINGNNAATDSFNAFINNNISGGANGIYVSGKNDSVGDYGIVISHNIVDSARIDGLYIMYEDSITITKNKILAVNLGLYVNYIIARGTKKDSSLIANNFIDGYCALSATNNSLLNIYNNTFVSKSTAIASVNLYGTLPATSVKLIDNIIMNLAADYAIFASVNGLTFSDYNNFYSAGTILANWNSTNFSSLSGWQSASSMDAHSDSTDPALKNTATGDLHLTSASKAVLHKAMPLAIITDDIDGQVRSSVNPSIGADDVPLVLNDGALETIDSTVSGLCSGTKDVWATIGNEGSNTISSMTISWMTGSTAMKPYSWTGTLASGSKTKVKLGVFNFTSGVLKKITAWTTNPNGATDGNTANDTVAISAGGALSGNYTIGGAGPDFTTFRDAAFALNTVGVCGATTFNVRSGHYNESVILRRTAGASNYNTITFQSQSLDSSKVVLDTSFAGATLFVVGSSHLNFNELTIRNNTASANSNAVSLGSNTAFINFTNCYIRMNVNSNAGSYVFNNTGCNNLLLKQNFISGGYYSINITDTAAALIYNNAILNNIIDSAYNCGIYPPYTDSLIIAGNRIFMPDANSRYGIYVYYTKLSGSGNDSSYIVNNFMTVLGSNAYVIEVIGCPQFNIYYNSIYANSSNQAFYYFNLVSAAYSYKFYNNIVYNSDTGAALFMRNLGTTYSDYNEYYSGGSVLAYYSLYPKSTTNCSNLKSWIIASGLDSHSISSKLSFIAASKNDLHITALPSAVGRKGINLAPVRYDIDGDPRTSRPDIGADQFNRDSNDVGVSAIPSPNNNYCGSDSAIIVLKVSNYGYKNQSGFNIHINVSGAASASKTLVFPGILKGSTTSGPHDTILYCGFSPALNTKSGGMFVITAYTDLTTDANRNNDTLTASVNITAFPKASFTFSKPSGYCLGDTLNVLNTSKGGLNYLYHLSDSTTVVVDSSINQNPLFSGLATGQYRLWLHVQTSGGGCMDSTSSLISIHNNPLANFSFTHVCSGDSVHFKDSSNAGAGIIKSYSWDFGNGKSAIAGNPVTVYTQGKTYTIYEKVTNTFGCSAKASNLYTNDTINAGFASATVIPGEFNFNANDSTYKLYSWDFGDKSSAGSGSKPAHLYSFNGKYIVTLHATDLKGCSNSWSDSVIVSGVITGLYENNPDAIGLRIYPNPFGKVTGIIYSLNNEANVRMEIFDILGRKIAELINEKQTPGEHELQYIPERNTEGTYILRMWIGERVTSRSLLIVK